MGMGFGGVGAAGGDIASNAALVVTVTMPALMAFDMPPATIAPTGLSVASTIPAADNVVDLAVWAVGPFSKMKDTVDKEAAGMTSSGVKVTVEVVLSHTTELAGVLNTSCD